MPLANKMKANLYMKGGRKKTVKTPYLVKYSFAQKKKPGKYAPVHPTQTGVMFLSPYQIANEIMTAYQGKGEGTRHHIS